MTMMIEMNEQIRNILHTALLSYSSAIGDSFPEIFKNNPVIEEAFKLVKPIIKEDQMALYFTAKEVSTINEVSVSVFDPHRRSEDIANKPFEKVKDTLGSKGPSDPDIAKRLTTSRGKFNTPRHVRNQMGLQKIGKELKECLDFLKENLKKPKSELKGLLENFPHKTKLFALVDHLIATSLGGWKSIGGKLVNETGHFVYPENWTLLENGRLETIGKSSPKINISRLHDIRDILYDNS